MWILAITALLGFIMLNIVAYGHAHAMLHFSDEGRRTQGPETLGFLHKLKTLITGVNMPRPVNDTDPKDVGLEFTTHRFPSTHDIEIEAWYITASDKPAGIVLPLHGYSVSKSAVVGVTKVFYDMGYSTFAIDFRGSGGSTGNDTSVGYHEANDICKAVKYIKDNISKDIPIIIYGQSMGGAAALRAIAELKLQPDLLILEGVFSDTLSTVKARFEMMGIPSFPSAHLLTFWGGQQMGYSAFRHNPSDYAAEVQCPTLVLNGEEDPRATVEQATKIMTNLTCKKSLKLFSDIGHESCYNAHPEQWKNIVNTFLKENLVKE